MTESAWCILGDNEHFLKLTVLMDIPKVTELYSFNERTVCVNHI